MNTMLASVVLSALALLVSIYTIVSTRHAETKILKLNSLLPHLSEISEKLNAQPFPNEVLEKINWINEMAAFFRKKRVVLHSIGLGIELNLLLSGKAELEEINASLQAIVTGVQSKYRELLELNS